MKILTLSNLYPPDFLGGYELACAQMVDAFRDQGHDVTVLTARPRLPVPSDPSVLRRFDITDEWSPGGMGSNPMVVSLREAESRVVNAYNVHVLTDAIAEFTPDVVYVNNLVGLGGIGLMGALQYLGVPWVWHIGDCIPRSLCILGHRLHPGLAGLFSREIRGTYLVVSNRTLDEINSDGLRIDGTIELIPYWITDPGSARRPEDRREGPLRVMAAGQVSVRKGADLLIRAAGLVRDAGHDLRLDLYGHANDPFFPALIRGLGLDDRVRLMGPRPQAQLLKLYADYDVFAFPTHHREPFGLVPLEALAQSCVPIITSDCGVAEWLVHGVHCLKAPRNAEAFAETLVSIIRGEVDLSAIARRGRDAVLGDFHIDAIRPRVEDVLRRVSRQRRPALGTPADVYRMARMAEMLTRSWIEDSRCA